MQIEKKLIACSILAIAIGIAAIAPLTLLMIPTSAQTTEEQPWFNLDINYATAGIADTFGEKSADYAVQYNYTVNPHAIDTKVGGRIEYYRLQIYSDKEQLANSTAYLAVNCSEYLDQNAVIFARKGWFNTSALASFGSFISNFTGNPLQTVNVGAHFNAMTNYYSENQSSGAKQMEDLQNAQTVYVDVHRIAYITCNNNSTTVHLANDEIIQHLELTKSGDHFDYGTKPAGWI